MACIKEYMCGNARIRIMDDDIAPPEEQERRNEAARRFRAALDARPIVPIS